MTPEDEKDGSNSLPLDQAGWKDAELNNRGRKTGSKEDPTIDPSRSGPETGGDGE
jgi:hypothetical protein